MSGLEDCPLPLDRTAHATRTSPPTPYTRPRDAPLTLTTANNRVSSGLFSLEVIVSHVQRPGSSQGIGVRAAAMDRGLESAAMLVVRFGREQISPLWFLRAREPFSHSIGELFVARSPLPQQPLVNKVYIQFI